MLRMPKPGRLIAILAGCVAVAVGLVSGANSIGNALRVPARVDDVERRISIVEKAIDQQNAKIDALSQEVVGGRREAEKSAERLDRQITGVIQSIATLTGTLDGMARTVASHSERISQAYEAARNAGVIADEASRAAQDLKVEQAKMHGKDKP